MRTIYLTTLIALAALLYGQQSFAAAEAVNLDQQLRNVLIDITRDVSANRLKETDLLEKIVISYQKIINLLDAGANPNYIPTRYDRNSPELYFGQFKDAYHMYPIFDCRYSKIFDRDFRGKDFQGWTPLHRTYFDLKMNKAFEKAIEKKLLGGVEAPPAYEAIAEEEGPKRDVEQAELGLGEWACNMCTLLNNPAAKICEICNTPKPVAPGGI